MNCIKYLMWNKIPSKLLGFQIIRNYKIMSKQYKILLQKSKMNWKNQERNIPHYMHYYNLHLQSRMQLHSTKMEMVMQQLCPT